MPDENSSLTADQAVAALAQKPEDKPEKPDTGGEPEASSRENAAKPEGQADKHPEGDDDEGEAKAGEKTAKEEPEEDEEEEDAQPEEDENKTLVELDLGDGKKYRVPPEIKDGYLRQSDYSKKTADLAEERKTLNGSVENVVRQYREAVEKVTSHYQELAKGDDLTKRLHTAVAAGDDVEILKIKDEYRDRQTQLAAWQAEQDRYKGLEHQKQIQSLQEYRDSQLKYAEEKVPGWKDGKVQDDLTSFFKKSGYTDEELNFLLDGRLMEMAYKAMKYDGIQAAKPDAAKKIAPKITALKPSGREEKSSANSSRKTALAKRFSASGSVDDAVELMKLIG